jgi:hypothetical protein
VISISWGTHLHLRGAYSLANVPYTQGLISKVISITQAGCVACRQVHILLMQARVFPVTNDVHFMFFSHSAPTFGQFSILKIDLK